MRGRDSAIVRMLSRHLWSWLSLRMGGNVSGELPVIATVAGETAADRTRIVF
jgi:hypothetical protein